MAATGFVGIEPDGALGLASALEEVSGELAVTAGRISALLAEAGEPDGTGPVLRELEAAFQWQAGDLRRRATLATFTVDYAGACEVPWWDPLRRALRAVGHNAGSVASGAWDSVSQGGSSLWQLVPGSHGGWRQSWVDLGEAWALAVADPGAALRAALGEQALDERGFSYWVGGFVPDVALYFLGGAGAVKTAGRVADVGGDVADAANRSGRLQRAAAALANRSRRELSDTDAPDNPRHRTTPPRDPIREPIAKAEVEAADAMGQGHSAARHGADTTLDQQRARLESGVAPDGGVGEPAGASRFFRWEDHADAIERARKMKAEGKKPPYDVRMDHPIGEGYMKGDLEYRRTATVRVALTKTGGVKTAYPNLKKGWAL